MAFELRMRPVPPPTDGPRFTSNEAIATAWRDYQETRLQPVTLRHYAYEIRSFLDAWTSTLATTLQPRDLRAYLVQYGQRCQFYRRQGFPIAKGAFCVQKRDLAACGKGLCPAYQPLVFATVENHLKALVCLYDFLVGQEALPHNFVRDVKRAWIQEHRHLNRSRSKRLLSHEDVRRLVEEASAPNRMILYALLAKTGARIKEVLLLRVDRDHMNLQEGWLKVPEFKGKRRGNRYLVVDDELRHLLQDYFPWREARVQRDTNQQPSTHVLVLNYRGEPFNVDDETSLLKTVVTPDCVRLGLMRPKESVTNRITPHRFRHYFSDALKKNGIDPYWWNVLRGDLPRGNEKTYVHPSLVEIRQQYRAFAPMLRLRRGLAPRIGTPHEPAPSAQPREMRARPAPGTPNPESIAA